MQSEDRDPQERTHGQGTAQSELPFKPMEKIRAGLVRDYDFSDNDAAGITMAMNDAIQLVLNRFDGLEAKVDQTRTQVREDIAEVRKDLAEVRVDLKSRNFSIVLPIVVSVVLAAAVTIITLKWPF